jgi:hypothetical protein
MKKIFVLFLVLTMVYGLCACASAPEVPEDATKIGYIIIPHADGDEYADIYNWSTNNGVVQAYCMDGRFIASPQIILVLENS